jgi:hypothetical protein
MKGMYEHLQQTLSKQQHSSQPATASPMKKAFQKEEGEKENVVVEGGATGTP